MLVSPTKNMSFEEKKKAPRDNEDYLKACIPGVGGAQCVLSRIDDGSDCGARLRWIPSLEKRGRKGRWSGSLPLKSN